jgi:hypothetical protein
MARIVDKGGKGKNNIGRWGTFFASSLCIQGYRTRVEHEADGEKWKFKEKLSTKVKEAVDEVGAEVIAKRDLTSNTYILEEVREWVEYPIYS